MGVLPPIDAPVTEREPHRDDWVLYSNTIPVMLSSHDPSDGGSVVDELSSGLLTGSQGA